MIRPLEELFTVKEVARCLHVGPETVRRWIRDGVLESIELPIADKRAPIRVRRSSVEAIIKTHSHRREVKGGDE